MQLTEYGISGIPVFQISACVARNLSENGQGSVVLDFMPDFTIEEVEALLRERQENCSYKNLKELLIGLFPAKLIPILVTKKITEKELAFRIKNLELPLKGTKSFVGTGMSGRSQCF